MKLRFWPHRRDAEIERELRAHLDLEAEEFEDRGWTPREANYAARRQLGNTTLVREEIRAMWRSIAFERLAQDIRYALRQLRRAPAFTAVAVFTLALGIGANTAIFSVLNAVLLRSLPVRDAGRLVYLNTTSNPSGAMQSGDGDTSLTENMFEQLRRQKDVLSELVAYVPLNADKIAVRYGSEPEEAEAVMVSGDFFSGLGIASVWGRTFTRDDETKHSSAAVLSYNFWTRRFARDRDVLGHTLFVKGVPFTIVGVAARGFEGLEQGKATDVWLPLQDRVDLQPWGGPPDAGGSLYHSLNWWCLKTIGRLAPGVSERQAVAALTPVFERAAMEGVPPAKRNERPPQLYLKTARGIEGMRDDYEQPLRVLMAMVGLVLVIACGNVAMLLAARNATRQREFSLRMALGGSRFRIFRQLLTESLLLTAIAGTLGWLFAVWSTRALKTWSAVELSLEPDGNVLAFALGISLVAGLIFGLAPLRSTARIEIGSTLKTSTATAGQDSAGTRGRRVVVALQTAFCVVLLVSAGLLVRTLRNLNHVDLGMKTSGLLVFGISPEQFIHSDEDAVRFYQEFLSRMKAIPGVEAATLMHYRLGSGWSSNSAAYVDGASPPGRNASMRTNLIGPDYFHVLEIPVRLGRDFNEADSPSAPRAVIINESFASRFLAGRNPLGHHVSDSNKPEARQYTIVGVVPDSKYTGVKDRGKPTAYLSYTQQPGVPTTMQFELRTAGDPAAMLPAVRRAAAALAADLAPLQPMTQQQQFEMSYSQARLVARLAMFFGALAALLVATGLYGTLAYAVSRRTAEVGIRMALGAERSQVLWMVLRGSLAISAAGLIIGAPLAIWATRFLRTMLFGLAPGDPASYAAALVGITIVTVGAGLIPALRAASVDPIVALRYE